MSGEGVFFKRASKTRNFIPNAVSPSILILRYEERRSRESDELAQIMITPSRAALRLSKG